VRGEAALDAALSGNPAVILMDVEMPGGIDGYQACRVIKDNAAVQHVPVIFMSARSLTEDRLKAYASGGDDYVSKPVSHHELRHKLTLALANQRKRVELAEKARAAANLAMTSMREAADAGAVLQFQSLIFRQTNPDVRVELSYMTSPVQRDKILQEWGIPNDYQSTKVMRLGPWYGDGEESHRSCRHLRECVTEFGAQGLGLDGVLLAWGTDLVWEEGAEGDGE
jgi:CheY-like chemotaxis protein